MHRIPVDTELLAADVPTLPQDAARHLKVLRLKNGEEIELFDGKGKWRAYAWDASCAAPRARSGIRAVGRPNGSLTLFACVTKGSRWDWTVEKATELGVTRIVPVISERTIVRIPEAERAAKRARWLRIAEDAARQSDAKWLPEIDAAVDFAAALPLVRETTCFVGALVTPPARPLAEAVAEKVKAEGGDGQGKDGCPSSSSASDLDLSVFIGPEGDFTPEELRALMAIATPTSFGPAILRAETAAIFAVSVLAASIYGRERT